MNYEQFLEQARGSLEERLSGSHPGVHVEIIRTEKLQNRSYTGLQVGLSGSNVKPVINPAPLFKELQEGRSFDSVMQEMVKGAEPALETAELIRELDVTDYESIKPRLSVQVVSREANREILEKMPHTDILDMAAVYAVSMGKEHGGEMFSVINDSMLSAMGITKEELHRDATTYAPLAQPARIQALSTVMQSMFGAEDMGFPEPQTGAASQLYVATTPSGVSGAGVLAYPGFMKEAAEKLGGDFYVLPSSIHEVLLLPVKGAPDYRELMEMVTEINSAVVRPEDRLTNNVYRYSAKERVFETAADYEKRDRKPSLLAALNDKKDALKEKAPAPAKPKARGAAAL